MSTCVVLANDVAHKNDVAHNRYPTLKCFMPRDRPDRLSFYLIVADYDRGVFAVEGPMTDDRPWQSAAREARSRQRKVACGPTGHRDELAAEHRREYRLAGVPPGSIVRPPP